MKKNIIDTTNPSSDTKEKFVMPAKEIMAIQRQLQDVNEIGDSLAYSVTYVTYMLSYTPDDIKKKLNDYAIGIANYNDSFVTRTSSKNDIFHSFSRASKGVLWLLPKSTVNIIVNQDVASHVEVYVKFKENEDDIKSPWYVLEFYYKLISTDHKLKNAAEFKILKNTNKLRIK